MSTREIEKFNTWIGLAHVKPRNDNNLLSDCEGAFVPVLAIATGVDNFASIIKKIFESLKFDVIEIEDIELFENRLKHSKVHEDVRKLAKKLSSEDPVQVDTFQAY